MSIENWVTKKSNSNITVETETQTPLDRSGSLRMSQENVSSSFATSYVFPIEGSPRSQFVRGKIRTLMEIRQGNNTANALSFCGIMGMLNRQNLFVNDESNNTANGKCYCAGRWGGLNPRWRIARVDHSIEGAQSFRALAGGSQIELPAIGEVCALEFEWIYDPDRFNGVRLSLSAAVGTDFSALKVIYRVIDKTNAHLQTSVGEGLFMAALFGTGSPTLEVLYDKTRIYQLVAL